MDRAHDSVKLIDIKINHIGRTNRNKKKGASQKMTTLPQKGLRWMIINQ